MLPTGSALAVHWSLDPSVHYLNHGSFGACPRLVLAEQARLRSELEAQPVRFLARELEERLDRTRLALAAFLGADPAGLVFVGNASVGVNTVLHNLRLRQGDEILVTNHEYAACRNALERLAAGSGARVVVAQLPFPLQSPAEVLAAIEQACSPRTRFCLIDHVTSPTALILPVAAIVQLLHARGVEVLIDGAHAPGMVDIGLEALNVEYYTGNCHKWLCAPKGSAFLHVRADKRAGFLPLVTSHGMTQDRPERSRFRLEHDWTGTGDPTPWLTVPAAIAQMATLGARDWRDRMAQNRALARQGRDRLCAALELPPPAPEAMLGAMAAIPLPPLRIAADPRQEFDPLQDWLWLEHRIEVPVIGWASPRHRLLRISAQAYNSLEQYDMLADLLRSLR